MVDKHIWQERNGAIQKGLAYKMIHFHWLSGNRAHGKCHNVAYTVLQTLYTQHSINVQPFCQTISRLRSRHMRKYLGNVALVCLRLFELVGLIRSLLLVTSFSCEDAYPSSAAKLHLSLRDALASPTVHEEQNRHSVPLYGHNIMLEIELSRKFWQHWIILAYVCIPVTLNNASDYQAKGLLPDHSEWTNGLTD